MKPTQPIKTSNFHFNIGDHVIIIALAAFWIFLICIRPSTFFQLSTYATIAKEASLYAICGIGMTFAIISGAFDLSVASQIALSACVFTTIVSKISPDNPGLGIFISCVVVIILGLLMGLVNGLLIARMRIPAFITTLAMQNVYRGLAQLVSNSPVPIATLGKEYQVFTSGTGPAIRLGVISPNFELVYIKGLAFTKILRLPLFFYIMIALAVIGTIILRKTRLGRNVLAVGNSKAAARIAGINIPQTQTITYVLVGLFTAVTALLFISFQGSSNYGVPQGTEFTVISAVVLGGTALVGGKGSILNTVIAALFITTIPLALTVLGIASDYHGIINGAILVFAFSINTINAYINDAMVKYRARKEKKF